MNIGYQAIDRDVIDYDLWFLPDKPMPALRGPRPDLESENLICFLGAAQTFGRFVDRPFATQVGEFLERPVLNLGFSGAGPETYLKSNYLMSYVKRADTVVVQCMSGRSVTAGVFEAQGNGGVLKFADGPRAGEIHMATPAYRMLREEQGEDAFRAQVAAVQEKWVELYREMSGAIRGRKLLLWISARRPGRNVKLDKSPLGIFPHLVTAEMVEEVRGMGFEFVDAGMKGMAPQILVNETTGIVEDIYNIPSRPKKTHAMNTYYATPELHDFAARRLIRALI